ncbi:hypothetical protein EDB85DRAFT_2297162 [Lactarius pseudohatsudake]|nr:hypothetical protein EDB85DRAFT_2297162 [Lactarius pseudohatsudake]
MNAAVVCDGKVLETYDVKQEGTSSLTAFIPSETGTIANRHGTNHSTIQQFKIKFSNNLTNFEFAIILHIDGRRVQTMHCRPGARDEFLGPYNSACTALPYKFHELQLVDPDPDLEDAPVAPEMGTIELKVYRCQKRCTAGPISLFTHNDLHQGRVSERSKKAGWHHVAYVPSVESYSPCHYQGYHYLDPWTGPPYASIKVFYRPKELLRALGIIPGNDVSRQGSSVNNNKRAIEDGSPGPSRSRQKIKREELSRDARAERMRVLQAEMDVLKATEQTGTSVKGEPRSPSPIVVKHPGEVVDLTLDD